MGIPAEAWVGLTPVAWRLEVEADSETILLMCQLDLVCLKKAYKAVED